jgi:ribosomal protein L40E
MMIVCSSCQHQNPLGAVQCEACYTPLPAMTQCPNCGSINQTDAVFCGQCGFSLQLSEAPMTLGSLALDPLAIEPLAIPDPIAVPPPIMAIPTPAPSGGAGATLGLVTNFPPSNGGEAVACANRYTDRADAGIERDSHGETQRSDSAGY